MKHLHAALSASPARLRRRLLCSAIALMILSGCAATPRLDRLGSNPEMASTQASDPSESVQAATFSDPRWPVSTSDYQTTSEDIYLANLEGRVSEFKRALGLAPSAGLRNAYASVLYHRFRVLGRVEDAELALALLDEAVKEEPEEPMHRLLRAKVRGAFHQFDGAMDDLKLAAAKSDEPEIHQSIDEVELALGRYADLKATLAGSMQPTENFYELASRADLRLLQGDPVGADLMFRAAQIAYADTNPVPLAWLHVQRGIAALRYREYADAKRFFVAAHERMPHYALATEHLAETEAALGNTDESRALYRAVIEQTGNPEFMGALAGVEREAGNPDAAAEQERKAAAGFARLYARHPAGYAQHYAEFLLASGQNARALELAEENIRLRQDVSSWLLLSRAAGAAGNEVRAAQALAGARATGMNPPELALLEP